MLPRKHRLPLRFERNHLDEVGVSHSTPSLTIITAPRSNTSLPSRFSTVISKKIDPKAVGRNRLRRRITGQLAILLPSIKAGHDTLLLPRKTIIDLTPNQISQALIQAFTLAGIYKA